MAIRKYPPLPSVSIYLSRILRNLLLGVGILTISLGIGMIGYSYFEKMNVIDAFLNASMILTGMGPPDTMHTNGGKIFAGFFAIFSGVIFLVVIAVILAPVFHRFLHRFHLKEK
ncbi:MAG TPA: hypothetical protein VLG44_00740 [Chlamydiales bacterium]|nr:hypothetical protein [Chlamydiales bacterium]